MLLPLHLSVLIREWNIEMKQRTNFHIPGTCYLSDSMKRDLLFAGIDNAFHALLRVEKPCELSYDRRPRRDPRTSNIRSRQRTLLPQADNHHSRNSHSDVRTRRYVLCSRRKLGFRGPLLQGRPYVF